MEHLYFKMVINICKVCKKEFHAARSKKKTCSKECFIKLSSILKMGELNPRFDNGWRQYTRIKENIKACENCGRGYKLEVHHKDGNHKNNNPDNLIKVCRRCHMLLDGRLFTYNKNTWHRGKKNVYSQETLKKMSDKRKEYRASKNGGG